jgi:hypothetical protein
MKRTLKISNALYIRLETMAREHGFGDIEQLLEAWQANKYDSCLRREVVHKVDQLRERLHAKYGEMPDSVTLIREDRSR